VLHIAERLEGSVRNTGIHAAGIIIAPKDLTELIPVFASKDTDLLITQIEGSIIEDSGVIKMDFLGLKTLSIIRDALKIIKENHGVDIDIDNLPLEDEKTYELYQRGDTIATFQFESPGMQKYLKELKPDQFADLIAMNALYRPGPMAYIPQYVDRKHGREEVKYDLEEMAEYLEETYGITVYQEQVMLLAQKLAGFSKGDADVLRKAMGKKDRKTLDKMKSKFIDGASQKGHGKKELEKIWTDWEAFAQYAFNKSHSTCYAFVAYQTAYLKAHYPAEYMAAVLNHANALEKLTFFMEECKRMGINVLGPDINESQKGFAVNAAGEIRFGLGGLKGVGENAVESIIAERKQSGPFQDPFDFIKRINQRTVNKKTLENLVYAGAFDNFPQLHRAQYFCIPQGETQNGLEKLVKYGNIVQAQSVNATNTLFGDLPAVMDIKPPQIPNCPVWSLTEQLEHEKEVAGIYLSGHPLDHYRFEMKHYGITNIQDFNEIKESPLLASSGKTIKLLALVTGANHRISRQGNKFGSYVIEDYSGKTELVLFGDDYVKFGSYLEQGQAILLNGAFRQRPYREEFEFKLSTIALAENIKRTLTKQLCLEVDVRNLQSELIDFLEENMKKYPGGSQLKIMVTEPKESLKAAFMTMSNGIEMNNELIQFLSDKPEIDIQVGVV
jgi:DNA polymerase-3 subunit alpha